MERTKGRRVRIKMENQLVALFNIPSDPPTFLEAFLHVHRSFPKLALDLLEEIPKFRTWSDIIYFIEYSGIQSIRDECLKLFANQLRNDYESLEPSLAVTAAPVSSSSLGTEIQSILFPSSKDSRGLYRKFIRKIKSCNRMLGSDSDSESPEKNHSTPVKECSNNDSVDVSPVNNDSVDVTTNNDSVDVTPVNITRNPRKFRVRGRKKRSPRSETLPQLPKTLSPSLIASMYLKGHPEDVILEDEWKAFKDSIRNCNGLPIPLVDTSGSMKGIPLDVATSLGILMSEVTHPAFKDRVMTFTGEPKWVRFSDDESLKNKLDFLCDAPCAGVTNISKALDIILNVCVIESLPRETVSKIKLIAFTDTCFDEAETGDPWMKTFVSTYRKYFEHGYDSPQVIFWNLRGEPKQCSHHIPGISIMQGFSQSMLVSFLKNEMTLNFTDSSALENPKFDSIRFVFRNHFAPEQEVEDIRTRVEKMTF